MELNELVDREAELSGDEKEEEEDEEDCKDVYNIEDSFINDNSVFTQVQKTDIFLKRCFFSAGNPSQLPRGVKKLSVQLT